MAAVTATGSEDLLIALATPAPKGYLGVPALLWGRPGQGKSSFVEGLAGNGFPVVTLIASIHDPTDFSGLPVHDDGVVRFVPPEWARALEDAKGGILFLDELTTAPPSVQSALLRVVLERTVGAKRLPPQVQIVAAANPPDIVAGGWELSPPLANRFVHIDWSLPGADFCTALEEGFGQPPLPVIDAGVHDEAVQYWQMITAAFLRRDPTLAHTQPADGEYSYASPRTWDFAVRLMASCDLLNKAPRPGRKGEGVFLRLLQGCVGSGAASSFVGFLKKLRLPDPEKVLDGKGRVAIDGLKEDELYVLFSSLSSCLLRRCEGSSPKVLDATLVLLSLVDQVNRSGRIDAVFAPLRQLARGQVLQHAGSMALKAKRMPELQRLARLVFEDTPLAEYVSVLA